MPFMLQRLTGNGPNSDQNLRPNLVPEWQVWGLLLRQLCPAAGHDKEGVLENITPDPVLCVSNRPAVQPGRARKQPRRCWRCPWSPPV